MLILHFSFPNSIENLYFQFNVNKSSLLSNINLPKYEWNWNFKFKLTYFSWIFAWIFFCTCSEIEKLSALLGVNSLTCTQARFDEHVNKAVDCGTQRERERRGSMCACVYVCMRMRMWVNVCVCVSVWYCLCDVNATVV